jgi:hypothetical protein
MVIVKNDDSHEFMIIHFVNESHTLIKRPKKILTPQTTVP